MLTKRIGHHLYWLLPIFGLAIAHLAIPQESDSPPDNVQIEQMQAGEPAATDIPDSQQHGLPENNLSATETPADESGATATPTTPQSNSSVPQKLLERAQQEGNVPVIIQLRLPVYAPEGKLSSMAAVEDQRARINLKQTQVLARLSPHGVRQVKQYKHLPFLALQVDAQGLQAMKADADVEAVYEDRLLPPTLMHSTPLIGATTAWQQGVTGNGQVVAILDTGVDRNHPFLANKVVDEACFSTTYTAYINSAPSNAYSVCPNGSDIQYGAGAAAPCPASVIGCDHGTHVAGIAAGSDTAFSGVARNAKIIAVQVFSAVHDSVQCQQPGNYSPCAQTFDSDIMYGLQHVYNKRGQFAIAAVNLSLGGGQFSGYCDSSFPYYKAAIDQLRSVGIATIVASGNDKNKNAISSPACISSAISVGATDKFDRVWIRSNSASILKLLAPGVDIYSSVPGSHDYMSGTSMAAPHVTGAFAALRSQLPSASIDTITNALWTTGKRVTDYFNYLITPRIQLDAAMNALAPTNDKVANATLLQGTSISTGGSNQGATKESGEPNHAGSSGGRSVWWRWTAPSSGAVTIDTFGSNFDTLLGVYRGTQLSMLTTVASNDDTGGRQSQVSFQAISGTTYSIAVDGYNGAMGSVVLHLAATTPYTLTVSKRGNGTVSSTPAGINCGTDCSEGYASGTVVRLTATPATGSIFAGWSGACSGAGACQVTMSQARSVSATFTVPYTLTVGKRGNGTVSSTPAGINCGTDCSEGYASGTVVRLTATPATGSIFAGWSGACSGAGACQVTMSQARSVSATFTVPYTLTVSKRGNGTVSSTPAGINCGTDCSEGYASGTVVRLTATPATGSIFAGWSGACSGAGACQVTMNQARSVSATFTLPTSSIGDTLYYDLNGNRAQDTGELGVQGG